MSYQCHVRGLEAHSSLAPQGVNAVEYAAELIAYLNGWRGAYNKKVRSTTFTISTHHGTHRHGSRGTALNIVPKDCSFEFEFRCIAGHDGREL